MLKKIISILLTLTVVISFGLPVSAAYNNNGVSPCYLYTGDVSCSLMISNGTATCSSDLTGSLTVTSITGQQYLEKKNGTKWESVDNDSWSDATTSYYLKMYNTKSGLGSGTYRVRAVFTVYCGSNSEVVEKTSKEVTI